MVYNQLPGNSSGGTSTASSQNHRNAFGVMMQSTEYQSFVQNGGFSVPGHTHQNKVSGGQMQYANWNDLNQQWGVLFT